MRLWRRGLVSMPLPRVDAGSRREARGGGAGGHVARVNLLRWPGVSATMVKRRVGDGEEAVGDVDGDALLALGLQAVQQQREVDALSPACRAP